jgi:hypothetical protein
VRAKRELASSRLDQLARDTLHTAIDAPRALTRRDNRHVTDHLEEEVTTRVASAADAPVIAEILTEAVEGYRAWAPEWSPPPRDGEEAFLGPALSRSDVWFLLAIRDGKAVGHVALSPFTMVQPEPPPAATVNLWQLFVRPPWQGRRRRHRADAGGRGRGVATRVDP